MRRRPSKPDRAARAARIQAMRERQQAQAAKVQQQTARRPQPDPRVRERHAQRLDALRRRRQAGPRRPRRKARRAGWGRWVALAVGVVLLWALLRNCQCSPPPEEAAPAPAPAVVVTPAPAPLPLPPPAPAPPAARVERQDRPELQIPPPRPLPWVVAFRMQVSARSPRLAKCFEGSSQPGQLKWTTSVDPSQGTVADHDLEPMLGSLAISARERSCVFEVLSDPAYQLPVPEDAPATPSRVGLVIEF